MRRGLLIWIAALGLLGCGAEIGHLPDDKGYGFEAQVNATPERVQPGQWVKFEVQLRSASNRPVDVALTLRLVEDLTGKVVFIQSWEGLHFELGEVYKITQNYLTATDTARAGHHVELEARETETGEVVWSNQDATRLEFGT